MTYVRQRHAWSYKPSSYALTMSRATLSASSCLLSPYEVEESDTLKQYEGDRALYWTNEPEQELDDDTVEYGDYVQASKVLSRGLIKDFSPFQVPLSY